MSAHRVLLVTMALTVTVFGVLFAAPRSAVAGPTDLGWGTPGPLLNHIAGDTYTPQVAMDANGNAMSLWIQTGGVRSLPAANRFTEGVGWDIPTFPSVGPGSAWAGLAPSMAMDAAGNAIAVWSETWQMFASRFEPATGWQAPAAIGWCCTTTREPAIASSPAGEMVVVWWQWDGGHWSIFGNRYVPGTGWTGTLYVELDNTVNTYNPRVAVDDSGNAIAVWYEYDGTRYRVAANRFVAGSGWGTAAPVEPGPGWTYYPDIAIRRDGVAVVVYTTANEIYDIWYTPGIGWGVPAPLTGVLSGLGGPRVAMNRDVGDAMAVWQRVEGGTTNLYVDLYSASVPGWLGVGLLEVYPDPVISVSVAMNRGTRALVAWEQSDGVDQEIRSRFFDPMTGWSGYYVISSPSTGDKTAPIAAMSDYGTGMVVYTYDDGEHLNVRATRFTGTTYAGVGAIEYDNEGYLWNHRLAVNHAGQGAAVWWQDDGPVANMYAATFHPASGWSPPTLLENVNRGNAVDAQVAVDEAGNAFAIWVQWDGASWNVWSSRYDFGIGWGAPYLMESMAGNAGWPQVKFDAAGNAISLWYQWDGSVYSIYETTWTAGGGWTPPTEIDGQTGSCDSPELGVAPGGSALGVWHCYDGTANSIYYSVYTPGVGWGTPGLAESNTAPNQWVRLAMNDAGDAILIWHSWNGVVMDLWANRWVGGMWTGEQLIDSEPGWVEWPVIAIDGRGNGIAAWHAWGGTEYEVFRVEFRDSGWGPVTRLSTSAGDAYWSAVVGDRNGNMMVAWQQWDGTKWNLHAQRYTAGTGWTTTSAMESEAYDAAEPRLAVDGAGNVLATWRQFDGERFVPWGNRYTVGDGGPSLRLFEPSVTLTNNPWVAVAGQTDPGATVRIDATPVPVDAAGRFGTTVLLPDGTHTFVVEAVNLAGNRRTETATITVDTLAPSVSITSPGDGYATNSPVIRVWGFSEPGATASVNGLVVSPDPVGGEFTATIPLLEGTQAIRAVAVDAAGNIGTAVITVTLDTLPPALYLLPLPQLTNNPNVIVQGSTEPTATVVVDGNTAFVNPVTGDFTYMALNLPNGPHVFTITASDPVGNTASRQVTVTVDTAAPNLLISDPVDGALTSNPIISVYGTTDPDARVTLNGIEVSVGPSGNFYGRIALSEGTQVLRADATDAAGNTATVTIMVTVDTIPPELSVSSPTDGLLTNQRDILVSGLTEPGASVTVNGVPVPVQPDGSFAYAAQNLPDGFYSFDIVATDPAGNVARDFRTATVDASPPVVSILTPAGGATVDIPTVMVSGATEPGVRLVVNGISVAVDPSSGTFSFLLALADGTNTITATATDAAGNQGTDSVSVTYVNPVPNLEQQLQQIQVELDQTQQDLQNAQQELQNTQQELQQTQQDLQDTQTALNNANDALNATQDDLDDTNTQLALTNANLAGLGTQLLLLLVLLIVSLAFGAMQFLSLRKLRGGGGGGGKTDTSKPDE